MASHERCQNDGWLKPWLGLFACCRKSGGSDPDHARMQGSELWNLAVWRMRWDGEVRVVERKLKNVSQVEFGVVAQTCAGIGIRVLALRDTEFPNVQTICLLACSVCHAYKDRAVVIFFGRNNETRSWFGFGVNVVREVAPDDFASRWFWPPAHQGFSNSKRLLRTVPPLAFGADFLT